MDETVKVHPKLCVASYFNNTRQNIKLCGIFISRPSSSAFCSGMPVSMIEKNQHEIIQGFHTRIITFLC